MSSCPGASFASTFPCDARVVGTLVRRGQACCCGKRLVERSRVLSQLVRQGKNEEAEGLLVVGLDLEDVEADAFGLSGFIQQSITLGLGQSSGDAVVGNRLGLKHWIGTSSDRTGYKMCSSFFKGSKYWSTT